MSKSRDKFSFQRISMDNDDDTEKLSDKFTDTAKYITQKEVRDYASYVAEKIKQAQSPKEKKVMIIDLLDEDFIQHLCEYRGQETQQIALRTVQAIKRQIIEELKKILDEEESFFLVKRYIDPDPDHMNEKIIISDKNNKGYFYKSNKMKNGNEANKRRLKCLEKIKIAIKQLEDSGQSMPFIIKPVLVEQPNANFYAINYITTKKDFTTLANIFTTDALERDTNFTIQDGLRAIVDCLRGAKFLADNNLTLTDLYTANPGRNLGIDNKTKKGILFDIDGLQQTDNEISVIIGQKMETLRESIKFFAPEYRKLFYGHAPIATTKSMIWEIGSTLLNLVDNHILFLPNNSPQKIGWEKIRSLAKKMSAEKKEDRPDFDNCIAELEKIVEKYFTEKK